MVWGATGEFGQYGPERLVVLALDEPAIELGVKIVEEAKDLGSKSLKCLVSTGRCLHGVASALVFAAVWSTSVFLKVFTNDSHLRRFVELGLEVRVS